MAVDSYWYIVGIGGIFLLVVAVIIWDQIRQAKKKSSLDQTAHGSPSSFDSESKTKMMSRLDKRESQLRRERILEGGTLPELSELVVYFPTRNEKITSTEVDVRGKTAVKSIVWINNQAAFVDVDGSFIGTVKLYRGKNQLDIVAIGPYGHTMGAYVPINCTSKEAPSFQSSCSTYLLPDHTLDIRHDAMPTSGVQVDIQSVSVPVDRARRRRGRQAEEAPVFQDMAPKAADDQIVVSEDEIDPSVLAALKGDPLSEDAAAVESAVDLSEIEPDLLPTRFNEAEIPPIPEITGLEDEEQISDIPEIPEIPTELLEEESEPASTVAVDEEEIDESVKQIEEVIETDKKFQPDEMIPKQPGEELTPQVEDIEEIKLDEFKPLQQTLEGTQELIIETKSQVLDDDRRTIILQHNGLLQREDGETIPVLKIEKRIECVDEKWFSTLGIANVSDVEINRIDMSEFISNTMELAEKLPVNVEDPIIDYLPEGVMVTWVMNNVKPQMKIFITYNEKANPMDIITEEQKTPKITIRK